MGLNAIMFCGLTGTFEQGDEAEEEVYEVINIAKIKAHTPNLRVSFCFKYRDP